MPGKSGAVDDVAATMRRGALPDENFWGGKRVFLTGHTGFKGGWLALWLHRLGATVCGYALAPPSTPNFFSVCDVGAFVQHHLGDVRDAAGLARAVAKFRPDIVFHLAAQPLVRASYAAPVDTFATNVMGTVNVLDAVRQVPGIMAAVIVTSDKVYAESDDARGHLESDALGGHDPYSASKACAELAAAAFPMNGAAHVATVRSGNVIGGGDWAEDRLVADFIRAIMEGKKLAVRQPESIRPWQHVLEPLCGYLVAAEFLCGEKPAGRPAWNFGPAADNDVKVADIARRLCALWGEAADYVIIAPDDALHEAPVLRLNSAKVARELGWRPRWNLDEALAATVDWFRAYAGEDDMAAFSLSQIAAYCQKSFEP